MKRRGGKFSMPEGYCVKCKAKKEIVGGVEETMKNGRKAIKGKCPTCGTVMFKILGGKAAVAPAPPATEAPQPAAPPQPPQPPTNK
jgi:ribosomal protein S27E